MGENDEKQQQEMSGKGNEGMSHEVNSQGMSHQLCNELSNTMRDWDQDCIAGHEGPEHAPPCESTIHYLMSHSGQAPPTCTFTTMSKPGSCNSASAQRSVPDAQEGRDAD